MRFGLQKTSLIDFPGRVSCVVFSPGCDLACPFCHNPELARPGSYPGFMESLLEETEIRAFLDKRKGVLEGVVFSGGEPCLNASLPGLIRHAREASYAVKVDTNGMHPEEIEGIDADFVSVDVKTAPSAYAARIPGSPPDAAERIRSTLGALEKRGIAIETRTTLAPGFASAEDIREMGEFLGTRANWVLQRFRPGHTLDPAWSDKPASSEDECERLLALARRACPRARLR